VRGADIDYVGITPDAMFHRVKFEHLVYLTFAQPALKFFHGHCVVRGVVEREVADLNRRSASELIDVTE